MEKFNRLELLIGSESIKKLEKARVFVFGLGGVGSWCAESLIRSGLGNIVLVDHDIIEKSNINRQIHANINSIGESKVLSMFKRLSLINSRAKITTIQEFYSVNLIRKFDISSNDFVVDAIDCVTAKIELAIQCKDVGAKLFSSMGTALKLNPSMLEVKDIWKTYNCPLARLVRQGLRKQNIKINYPCVFSRETSIISPETQKKVLGSAVQVTATAGMILSYLVLDAIINE